jgi:hypothetical protein
MLSAPHCRFCGSTSGDIVLDLGPQPSSEYFPALADPGPDPVATLRMWLCADCRLAQLADRARLPEDPVGLEPAAVAAQRIAALDWLTESGLVCPGDRVAEFGSPHGGSFADLLAGRGMVIAGHDEAADVVLDGCFGLMHAADQRAALHRRVARLRPGGRLVLQFHSLAAILRGGQWNMLRHGHVGYYSTPALSDLLGRLGLTAIGARWYPLYGGTVCLVATSSPDPDPPADRPAVELLDLLEQERAAGVSDVAALRGLQAAAARTAAELRAFVLGECARGARVYGYGAASRAVALLNLAGLHDGVLLGIADAAPAKQGSRLPGTRIPVISPAELVARTPDVVLVFVPELLAQARAALPCIELGGGRWVDAAAPAPGRPHRTDGVAPRAAAAN